MLLLALTATVFHHKRCTACKTVKSLLDYHVRRSARDGRSSRCKPCQIAHVLATVDPERVKRASLLYYHEHREQRAAYRIAHIEQRREYQRRRSRLRRMQRLAE